MSSFKISKAKDADVAIKLLIFGYIRNMSTIHELSMDIPDLICITILIYYMENEYFDKPGQNIEISADKLTATRIKGNSYLSTTYCKQCIPSLSNMIIKWRLKVNKMSKEIGIGVTSNDNLYDKDFMTVVNDGTNTTYGCQNDGYRVGNGEYDGTNKDIAFEEGDEITFILNLKKNETMFQRNNDEQLLVWSKVKVSEDIKYKFIICLYGKDTKITLINFEQES